MGKKVESESEIEVGDDDIETVIEEETTENYDYVRQQQQQMRLMTQSSCCRHAPGDEIMHFFRSITPYLQMMEPTAKLRIRIEIQEIILSELSGMKQGKNERNGGKICEKKTETRSVVPTRVSQRVVKKNRKYFRK